MFSEILMFVISLLDVKDNYETNCLLKIIMTDHLSINVWFVDFTWYKTVDVLFFLIMFTLQIWGYVKKM